MTITDVHPLPSKQYNEDKSYHVAPPPSASENNGNIREMPKGREGGGRSAGWLQSSNKSYRAMKQKSSPSATFSDGPAVGHHFSSTASDRSSRSTTSGRSSAQSTRRTPSWQYGFFAVDHYLRSSRQQVSNSSRSGTPVAGSVSGRSPAASSRLSSNSCDGSGARLTAAWESRVKAAEQWGEYRESERLRRRLTQQRARSTEKAREDHLRSQQAKVAERRETQMRRNENTRQQKISRMSFLHETKKDLPKQVSQSRTRWGDHVVEQREARVRSASERRQEALESRSSSVRARRRWEWAQDDNRLNCSWGSSSASDQQRRRQSLTWSGGRYSRNSSATTSRVNSPTSRSRSRQVSELRERHAAFLHQKNTESKHIGEVVRAYNKVFPTRPVPNAYSHWQYVVASTSPAHSHGNKTGIRKN